MRMDVVRMAIVRMVGHKLVFLPKRDDAAEKSCYFDVKSQWFMGKSVKMFAICPN